MIEESCRTNVFYLGSNNKLGLSEKGRVITQINALKITQNGLEIQDSFSLDKHTEMRTVCSMKSYSGTNKQDFLFVGSDQSILIIKINKNVQFQEFYKFKSLLSGPISDISFLNLNLVSVSPMDRLISLVSLPNNFETKKEIDFTNYTIEKTRLRKDRSTWNNTRDDEQDIDKPRRKQFDSRSS